MTQQVMDWNPYAELMKSDDGNATKEVHLVAETEETVRREHQALGVAAMAGALRNESAEAGADGEVEAEAETEATSDKADTIIARATGALGQERFVDFVGEMMDSADDDTPQETLRKFRESEEASQMDAKELWQAVLAQSKRERYPELAEYREQAKFYITLDRNELAVALKTGKLERTDGGGSTLGSNLVLSSDRLGDGHWKSGFEEGQAVTLVLDGSLVDKSDMVTLSFRPTVDEVDLKKYCLGFVTDFRDERGRQVQRMVRKSELAEIPVYQMYDGDELVWATKMFSAADLREQRRQYAAEMKEYKQEMAEIYTDASEKDLRQRIEKYARRLDQKGMEKIIEEFGRPRTDEEGAGAEQALIDYYAKALELKEAPELVREDDKDKRKLVEYRQDEGRSEIRINTARLDESNLGLVAQLIGAEMWRMHQQKVVELVGKDYDGLSDEEKQYAERLRKNFLEEIKLVDDVYQHRRQMKEIDASLFGQACANVYEGALAEVNKLANRVRRGAGRVREGAGKMMSRVGTTSGE